MTGSVGQYCRRSKISLRIWLFQALAAKCSLLIWQFVIRGSANEPQTLAAEGVMRRFPQEIWNNALSRMSAASRADLYFHSFS